MSRFPNFNAVKITVPESEYGKVRVEAEFSNTDTRRKISLNKIVSKENYSPTIVDEILDSLLNRGMDSSVNTLRLRRCLDGGTVPTGIKKWVERIRALEGSVDLPGRVTLVTNESYWLGLDESVEELGIQDVVELTIG